MQNAYATIGDYHARGRLRVQEMSWPSVRAATLVEGSGDVRFVRTARNGLVLTLDGSAAHLTRMDGIDDATASRRGEVCLIPEGIDVHLAWRNHHALQRSLMVEFDASLFATYAPELATDAVLRGHLIPANFASRPRLARLIRLVVEETVPDLARGRLFAESAIRLLALEIAGSAWTRPARIADGRGRADARIRRAVDFIEAHFRSDITILEIAAAAGLSPTQLTQGFRAAVGTTPYAHVIDRRLAHAVRLLRTTDMPLAVVALDAGFADQSHLTRLCRARLGRTPRQIRLG